MTHGDDIHLHFHIYEGASPEAIRAGVEAARSPIVAQLAVDDQTEAEPGEFPALVKRAYMDSYAKAKRLLEYLAANPERWIAFGEVSKALGFTNNRSLPGTLGAFGRRAAHRYGGVKPFEARRINGNWRLRMSGVAAKAITDAL